MTAYLEFKRAEAGRLDLKAAGGGWEVEGYASTWHGAGADGEADSYGDLVAPGAFAESLRKRRPRLLWQHDPGEPIGQPLDLREDRHGLYGRWSIVPTKAGTKAHTLLAAGLIDALSIGFIARDAGYRDDGARILRAVDLYEVSLVTIPANAGAVVTGFKSRRSGPWAPEQSTAPAALALRLEIMRRKYAALLRESA